MAIITNLYTLFIKIGSLGATVKRTNILPAKWTAKNITLSIGFAILQ